MESVATFSKGSGYSKGDLQENGTPIILYGRLYTKYETTISEVDTFVSEKSGSVYSKGGEVIIPASGETAEDIARAATVENKGILLGGDLNVVTPNEDVDSAFLALSISNGAAHKELASKAQGKSVVHIHNAEIQALNIAFPSKPEQKRISGYFAELDHLITLHQRKKRRIYTTLTIDWEQRKLSEIADKVTEKNKNNEFDEPFTNSAEQGIISQKDYFDRDIVNEENLGNYYIVRNDDFVYNPRISVTAPVGPINRNRLGRNGVMSPLYTVFRTKDVEPLYLEYYFKTTAWHRFMKLNGDSGARFDRFTISSQIFMEMPIPYPCIEEQNKVGRYFDELEKLITLHQWKCKKSRLISKNDWEQRKLGEFGKATGGTSIESEFSEDGVYKVISIGSYSENSVYNDQGIRAIKSDKTSNRVLNRNDLTMILNDKTTSGNIIGRVLLIEESGIYVYNQRTERIEINLNEYDSVFLYEMLNAPNIREKIIKQAQGNTQIYVNWTAISLLEYMIPSKEEQAKIGNYFTILDHIITLHQCKPYRLKKMMGIDWEQRKLGEVAPLRGGYAFKSSQYKSEGVPIVRISNILSDGSIGAEFAFYDQIENDDNISLGSGDALLAMSGATTGKVSVLKCENADKYYQNQRVGYFERNEKYDYGFVSTVVRSDMFKEQLSSVLVAGAQPNVSSKEVDSFEFMFPSDEEEQVKIGEYFSNLDTLITLHQREVKLAEKAFIYTEIQLFVVKEITNMAELEALIEQKLIDQLVYGDSQWTYRQDLKTEADLWNNFRYILEQNNKDRLNGEPLTDAEFDQVKNQLQFSSFYKAGEWLVGENGKVMVHVQRDTEKLHLVVMNHEHIAGGSSVYEVINQYQALDTDGNSTMPARDRRFDVTLMINGLPMIHIELKNKQHPYMDGFRQIKKYIGEGKFTGIFSAVQMFVVSNGVDTKYFAAASDRELNDKFLSGWVDNDNNPVTDYLDFAKSVLRIPQAHEMIARYTVLDEDAKRLIILRPYQIHAIEAIRDASKNGKSGFVWHTTGSGKTLTSYKATRNLLMDIPSLDKTIFLIDRKDLDTQTTQAFQAYANNDLIDVDETDNVFDLKNKLKSDDRQVIVTTIQKLQILITKRLKEGTPEYDKIKDRRIAFVVDECHRAVTPNTKRLIERFFGRSLWYGFTGTPRFAENPYPQMGDLPRTTEELYGERLHRYTIQNAIHDNAVLGFQVEHNGPKNVEDETDVAIYDNETHMLSVLEIILNRSFNKLGFQNGKGKTYEGLLTVSSIQLAQKYYDLLTRVKNGETSLVIDEKIKQVLPDFPKFAITYSVSENAEGSQVNQQKMQKSLDDYNGMFGTKYDLAQIQGYNANLNKRLARKDHKYDSRNEQLDLVIVVDRLLTGFDAPCMSTIFIDRQPMGPHDLIQAFSRTNRIFDKNKVYGQIVTFQAPVLFKEAVDTAVKLYSAGGTKDALMAEWDEVEPAFRKSLAALKVTAESPADIPGLSKKEKKIFVKIFQEFDRLFSQVKSFTVYDESMLEEYGITQQEYDDYAGHYKNVVEELKDDQPDKTDDPEDPPIDSEYELMAYSNTKIDYEYIINLIQNIVTPENSDGEITPEERQKKIDEVKQYVDELRKENPKVAEIMSNLIDEIETDDSKYKGQSILNIIENTKEECIDKVITDFCLIWYASKEEVMYAATHYRNGEIPNESAIKATIDFTSYKAAQERALPKFKYYAQMMAELKKTLDEEIKPLITR